MARIQHGCDTSYEPPNATQSFGALGHGAIVDVPDRVPNRSTDDSKLRYTVFFGGEERRTRTVHVLDLGDPRRTSQPGAPSNSRRADRTWSQVPFLTHCNLPGAEHRVPTARWPAGRVKRWLFEEILCFQTTKKNATCFYISTIPKNSSCFFGMNGTDMHALPMSTSPGPKCRRPIWRFGCFHRYKTALEMRRPE